MYSIISMAPNRLAVTSDKTGQVYPCPAESNDYLAAHVQLLLDSLRTLTGHDLVDPGIEPVEAARRIFHAPFVVLSHNTDPDPVLTYANQAGMKLFEMDWEQVVVTPSRYTAETQVRDEREQLLARVAAAGYINDYAGVRIASSGRRFRIAHATVWNLVDKERVLRGQAATFDNWICL